MRRDLLCLATHAQITCLLRLAAAPYMQVPQCPSFTCCLPLAALRACPTRGPPGAAPRPSRRGRPPVTHLKAGQGPAGQTRCPCVSKARGRAQPRTQCRWARTRSRFRQRVKAGTRMRIEVDGGRKGRCTIDMAAKGSTPVALINARSNRVHTFSTYPQLQVQSRSGGPWMGIGWAGSD